MKMMVRVSEQAVMFINSSQRILFCLSNMSPEQYIKATTQLMAWAKFDQVNQEVTVIIDRLKDDNISLKFDTGVLQSLIMAISELHIKIEKIFVDKTPEELAQEKP